MAKKPLADIFTSFLKRGVISSIWSSSAAYTAGQYAIYNNYIYRCTKNASAGTVPTDTTYWVKTDLASEITSLNSNFASLNNTLGNIQPKLLYSGNFSSGTITVENLSSYTMIVIIVDTEFMVIGTQSHGIGGYVPFGQNTSASLYAYSFLYDEYSNTLTIDSNHPGVIYNSSNGNGKSPVQKIYGIF